MQYRGWVLKAAALAAAGLSVVGSRRPGSDVIVGEIHNAQYNGQANNMASWSLGTTSCNKGDVPFQWLTSSNSGTPGTGENRHPVIGQNLFRVIPGTRHHPPVVPGLAPGIGFTALQNNACNFGCSAYPNGTYLGVGCPTRTTPASTPASPTPAPRAKSTPPPASSPSALRQEHAVGQHRQTLQGPLTDSPSAPASALPARSTSVSASTSPRTTPPTTTRTTTPRTASSISPRRASPSPAAPSASVPGIYAWKDHGLGLNTPDPRSP